MSAAQRVVECDAAVPGSRVPFGGDPLWAGGEPAPLGLGRAAEGAAAAPELRAGEPLHFLSQGHAGRQFDRGQPQRAGTPT